MESNLGLEEPTPVLNQSYLGGCTSEKQKLITMLYKQKQTCSDESPPLKLRMRNKTKIDTFLPTDHCVVLRHGRICRHMRGMVLEQAYQQ